MPDTFRSPPDSRRIFYVALEGSALPPDFLLAHSAGEARRAFCRMRRIVAARASRWRVEVL